MGGGGGHHMRARVPCAYVSMCSFVCSDFDQWRRSRSAASERDNAQFVSVKCNQNKLVSCVCAIVSIPIWPEDLLFLKPAGPSRLPESWITAQSSRKKNKKYSRGGSVLANPVLPSCCRALALVALQPSKQASKEPRTVVVIL